MSLKKNVAANVLGRAWTSIIGFVFLPYYLQLMGEEAFGLVGFSSLLISFAALLDLGMTPTLTRSMSQLRAGKMSSQSIHNLLRSVECFYLLIVLVITVIIFAASGWIGERWLKPETLSVETISRAISIIAFLVGTQFALGIYQGALFGLEKQVFYNILNALLGTIRHFGALLLLMFVSRDVNIFFLWQASLSVFTLGIMALAVHWFLPAAESRPRFAMAELQKIFGFATAMSIISILSVLLIQTDKVILSYLLGLKDFGYYTLAASVSATLLVIAVPLTQSVFPKLYELVAVGDSAGFVKTYHQGSQLISVTLAPAAIFLIFFARELVFVWSGNATLAAETHWIVRGLALGTFLNCLLWMPYQSMIAHEWTSLIIKAGLVSLVLMIPATIWITTVYGATGAAFNWVALTAGNMLVVVHLMHKRILCDQQWRWWIYDVALPVGAVAFVAVISLPVIRLLEGNRIGLGIGLVAAGCIATGVALLTASETRAVAQRLWNLRVAGPLSVRRHGS